MTCSQVSNRCPLGYLYWFFLHFLGKKVFSESLSQGYMECYFKLAEQFRTQDEPAFCGLTTLVMVLNSLSVDPGRVWKGPWRWYHENMLDCCVPLKVGESFGVNWPVIEKKEILVIQGYCENYTMHNTFSNSLFCFTSYFAHISAISNNFMELLCWKASAPHRIGGKSQLRRQSTNFAKNFHRPYRVRL